MAKGETKELKDIKKALAVTDREETAEYMAELLMDDSNSSWKMFEDLASSYINGTPEERRGLNCACSILTGWNIDTIARELIKRHRENKKSA